MGTLTKAEETLLVELLTNPVHHEVKYLATQLAAIRPDGVFGSKVDHSSGANKTKELTFKYVKEIRGGRQLNITFALHSEPVGKPKLTGTYSTYELQFIVVRSGFVGEQQFTQKSTNGVRISPMKLKWFSMYEVDDRDELDFDHCLKLFESSLGAEVGVCTTKFKRKKTTAGTKSVRQVNNEAKLREELFTTHNLVGNERREKLFAYLLKHCNKDLRMVERMFGEMVHIIE
jgi:hypothetical protein